MNMFSMYDQDGGTEVAKMVDKVKESMSRRTEDGMMLSEESAYNLLLEQLAEIGKDHEEVFDTEVRHSICFRLEESWAQNDGHPVDQWKMLA